MLWVKLKFLICESCIASHNSVVFMSHIMSTNLNFKEGNLHTWRDVLFYMFNFLLVRADQQKVLSSLTQLARSLTFLNWLSVLIYIYMVQNTFWLLTLHCNLMSSSSRSRGRYCYCLSGIKPILQMRKTKF